MPSSLGAESSSLAMRSTLGAKAVPISLSSAKVRARSSRSEASCVYAREEAGVVPSWKSGCALVACGTSFTRLSIDSIDSKKARSLAGMRRTSEGGYHAATRAWLILARRSGASGGCPSTSCSPPRLSARSARVLSTEMATAWPVTALALVSAASAWPALAPMTLTPCT